MLRGRGDLLTQVRYEALGGFVILSAASSSRMRRGCEVEGSLSLPWDSSAAGHYAMLRSSLEDSGEPMGNIDMMIASQALSGDVVLVTHERVFRHIKHLTLEDRTRTEDHLDTSRDAFPNPRISRAMDVPSKKPPAKWA